MTFDVIIFRGDCRINKKAFNANNKIFIHSEVFLHHQHVAAYEVITVFFVMIAVIVIA